jgi:hypothetical protein
VPRDRPTRGEMERRGARAGMPRVSTASARGGRRDTVTTSEDAITEEIWPEKKPNGLPSESLTPISLISTSAARTTRERASRCVSGPRACPRAAREGSRHPLAIFASEAILARLARAENHVRHSVNDQCNRNHEPDALPAPLRAGRHGRLPRRPRRSHRPEALARARLLLSLLLRPPRVQALCGRRSKPHHRGGAHPVGPR